MQTHRAVAAGLALTVVATTGYAARAVTAVPVFFANQLAPWRSDGATLDASYFDYRVRALPDGTVLATAYLTYPGTGNSAGQALFLSDHGVLTKVVETGDLIGPERRAIEWMSTSLPLASPSGSYFAVSVTTKRPWEGEETRATSAFVIERRGGAVGDPSTFQMAGTWTEDSLDAWAAAVNDNGQAVVNRDRFYLALAGNGPDVVEIVGPHVPLPDRTPPAYEGLRVLNFGNDGTAVIAALGSGPTLSTAELYSGSPGNVRRIVGLHDPAPAAGGATFAKIGSYDYDAGVANASGHVAFLATLDDPSGPNDGRRGIWTTATSDGALALVTLETDGGLSTPSIDGRGDVLFRQPRPEAGGASRDALWLWRGGSLTRIVGVGDPLAGGTVSDISHWALGPDGTIAFEAAVWSPTDGSMVAIWGGRPDDWHLIIRSYDRVDFGDQSIQATGVLFGMFSDDMAITSDGRLFARLSWSDGTTGNNGLFLLDLPEPGGSVAALAAFGLLGGRRRRG